jgi:hypothetical protein
MLELKTTEKISNLSHLIVVPLEKACSFLIDGDNSTPGSMN